MAGIRDPKTVVRLLRQRAGPRSIMRATLWGTAIPLLRRRARGRLASLHPGEVTVVTVNWNSSPFLGVLLELVRARSPAGTRILVVDNASSDGTRELLAAHPDVRSVRIPTNVGH